MIPAAYRSLVLDRRTRRLLAGLGPSSLGDGMSTVTTGLATVARAGVAAVFWKVEPAAATDQESRSLASGA